MGRLLIFFLLVFILSVVQLTLISLNLALPLILIFLLLNRSSPSSLKFAFLSGLISDLVLVRPLGLTSLFLIILAGALNLYRQKFDPSHPLFVLTLFAFGLIVYNLLWQKALILSVLIREILWGFLLFKLVKTLRLI